MAAAPSKKVAELKEPPEFIADRMKIWDRLKNERDAWVADQPREVITITLPDGKEVPGTSWSTTPYEVASGISKGLADNCIVCKVDGEESKADKCVPIVEHSEHPWILCLSIKGEGLLISKDYFLYVIKKFFALVFCCVGERVVLYSKSFRIYIFGILNAQAPIVS